MTASIRYIVDDVDRAIDFYRDRLGFDLDLHPAPGFAGLHRGDLRLYLNAPGAGGAGRAGGAPEPGGWNRFQVEVEELEAFVDDLRKKGVSLRGEIMTGQGGTQAIVEDPSGNPIELFQPAG
jgi:catechol 2,3-dioxygenase-like lactoylglutathione lyase family enzyme